MAYQHEVPNQLNVEDRAFFGLSVRQFTDLIAGLAGAYSLWNQAGGWPLGLRAACDRPGAARRTGDGLVEARRAAHRAVAVRAGPLPA